MPAFLAELKPALASDDHETLYRGCRSAIMVGKPAAPAAAAVAKVLSKVGGAAADALAEMGSTEPEVLAALVGTLDDKNVASASLATLTRLGPRRQVRRPGTARKALNTENIRIRYCKWERC